ncbi:MAG: PEP-CTERM sorting domain-containing protein [Thermoguttaceae bacterium]
MAVFLAVLGVLTYSASALAQGGTVLPSSETPNGYSLLDMAASTAAYNVGGGTGTAPDVPFQILTVNGGSTTVNSSTTMYLPVFFADNAPPPTTPPFPTDVTDQNADAIYLNNLAGVDNFLIQVDGNTTMLDNGYISGVATAPLPDGATGYIVSAAFLTPLTPGEHTIGLGGVIGGSPQVFVTETVDSVPEPSTFILLGVGAVGLLGFAWRRRRQAA